MRIQLIAVGILAALAGMMTQGPVGSIASTETAVPVELSKALLEADQQIDRLEQLVKYRARWTFPGSIEGHMQAHGVDTSGKTRDQLLAEHDAIHDVVGPVRAGEPIPQVSQISYRLQDCPNGQCPVVNAVSNVTAGTVKATGAVVRAVTPPYGANHSGAGYGSTGGYSTTTYSSTSYGSTGYSASRSAFRARPVRTFAKRLFCR